MLMNTNQFAYKRSKMWGRVRVQLGGALVAGIILPFVATMLYRPSVASSPTTSETIIGLVLGIVLSFYFLRNVSLFANIKMGYFVLPCVLAGFSITLAMLLFLRLEYNRSLLLSSFLLTLLWFYLASFLASRGQLRIGIVPFGEVDSALEIKRVDWSYLKRPVLDRNYEALVADFRADLPDDWEAFLADCALAGLPVLHVKQLKESLTGRVEVEHLSENNFGSLVPFMAYLRMRRAADLLVAVVAGAALLLPLLVVALIVRLESPGPALYRQRRVGYRGQPFDVLKFRTMYDGRVDEDARHAAMTRNNDERITRFGRFLRRTRIDELPQIVNILKGEMSWIGPRPEAEVLSRWYEAELPYYRYRHIVPPGITGWAQVNQGHVAEIEHVSYKLHYDFYYIKYFSAWLDALIVARTIHIVLTGFGAR